MSAIADSFNELPTVAKVLLVVGVGFFLLIPLTVILAAVLGSFVLGLGEDVRAAGPTVEFSGSYDDATADYTITHASGDSFSADRVEIRVNGANTHAWDGSGTVTGGDQTTVPDVSPGDTIEILWWGTDDGEPIRIGELTVQ